MKHTESLNLVEYYKYLDHIEECKAKEYDSDLVLHRHHVIPKCFDTDRKETVVLSVDDHITAHIMLSNCFTEGSYEMLSNLRAAKVLQKKSIKYKQELEKLYKHSTGENNPFWGKTHTDEVKQHLSQTTKDRLTDVSYEQRYGDRAQEEKEKRRSALRKYYEKVGGSRPPEVLEKIRNNHKPLRGADNGMAKAVEVNNVLYGSIQEAAVQNNLSIYKLKKLESFKYI